MVIDKVITGIPHTLKAQNGEYWGQGIVSIGYPPLKYPTPEFFDGCLGTHTHPLTNFQKWAYTYTCPPIITNQWVSRGYSFSSGNTCFCRKSYTQGILHANFANYSSLHCVNFKPSQPPPSKPMCGQCNDINISSCRGCLRSIRPPIGNS